MKKLLFSIVLAIFVFSLIKAQTVKDIDSNVYNTVTLGNQVWMKENLKVTHYQNGDPIPNVKDNGEWNKLLSGAYCDYDNDASNGKKYGHLYNWYAVVDSRNICPTGWHMPNDFEWIMLLNYLGGDKTAGGDMKQKKYKTWKRPNVGATNSSGFTGLASGYRNDDGVFYNISIYCDWWSTKENKVDDAWHVGLGYDYEKIYKYITNKKNGFSIRCLKD